MDATVRLTTLRGKLAAAERADFPLLAAAVAVMSLLVVAWSRTVWHACYRLSERRFSLDK